MALTLAQRSELQTVVNLLRNGEKPSISPAVNRRIVRVLREVLGDLAPGSDEVAFNDRPVRSLIEALLAADTAWACPECEECPELPPMGSNSWMDTVEIINELVMSVPSIIPSITSLNFPALKQIHVMTIYPDASSVTEILLPELLNDAQDYTNFSLSFLTMPSLTTISLPKLISGVSSSVTATGCPQLANVIFTNAVLGPYANITITGAALTEETVNNILIKADAALMSAGEIDLSGGTSAAPTGAGAAAKAAIIGRGATVTTN